ncbi:hypothetical protein G3M48_007066 [Beauveria asiatica]|uniref:Uncharacterized protein n=1 Tax=Beauveria asiatica TaxID=1069075 RepID=A0AAW0RND0_9HYPO
MAGAVFQSHHSPRPPRAPEAAASSSSVVAGPSSSVPPTQYEMQPMMTPAVWRDEPPLPEAPAQAPPPPPRRSRRRPLSDDLVLERALPRASHRYGLTQAIARSVTLSLAIAGLGSALYLAARWHLKRAVAGVSIGANAVAIIIDAFMLVDLINTNLPRVSPYAIGGLDGVMLAAALTAGFFVELSDQGYEADPAPWHHVMVVTAGLTWATA